MKREDLEKEYVGKCLEIENYDKNIFHIVIGNVYVHSKDSIVFEGDGYSYNEYKGLNRRQFEINLTEEEIPTKIKILSKEEFLKKLEWFYISDMERILNNYSEAIETLNKRKNDTSIKN